MMNLTPMGSGVGGNSSSSSSNLSALAPPFTVDRLNPSFNSSPLLHYSDTPHMVEPFNHAWQYARPSAPGPELVIHSTGKTGVRLSDGYQNAASKSVNPSGARWSAPGPVTQASGSVFAYAGEINPYCSPYVPPLVEEESPFVPNQGCRYNVVTTSGMTPASQLDYTQSSFDLEYRPQRLDGLGFDDGKRAKRVEFDGGFLSNKANVGVSCSLNQLDQGGYNTRTRNKSKEESEILYQMFDQAYDAELHTGALNVGRMEDKHLGKNVCFFSNDSKKSNILESSPMYQESHPLILSNEMPNNIPNYQSSYTPYDKCIRPGDVPFAAVPSVMRPSTTVVIRPPPATNVHIGQSTFSHKPARADNGEGVQIMGFGHYYPSKQNDTVIESSFKINEEDSKTTLINFSKKGDGLDALTSEKELSEAFHSAGTSAHKINTRFVPQLPDLSVSGGSAVPCDNVQVSNPADVNADLVDNHNLGVDSPCWKGAPYSKISPFDVEAGDIKGVEKSEYHGCDHENQNVHRVVGSDGVSSENFGQGNKNNQNDYLGMDGVERTLDPLCSSNERSLLDDVRCYVQIPTTTSSEGVDIVAEMNMLKKDSGPWNNLSGFDMKDCGTKHLVDEEGAGITPIYASEGGDIAVHAAEKVLDSPAMQDSAAEHPKLPDPKLNVPTMIKALHNLSELLLSHLSNHADSLDGECAEALKHIISNLDSCLGKKIIQASDKPELNKHVGDTPEKLGESCDVGTISENHTANEVGNSNIMLEYGNLHEGVGTSSFSGQSGKKDKKLTEVSSFMDGLDMTRDNDMVKAIKKVLEDDFQFDEEMSPQALLFKNLWLEAEAKLCSISYKARFDRMKILMGETKFEAPQVTASKVPAKVHDNTIPKSTLQDYLMSSTSGHAVDIEASVMDRFNILKSREENTEPINLEQERQPAMVDGEHAPPVMARFNVLKSHEGNSKSISVEEEEESDVVDGEHATAVMARFNILKSREGNSKSVSVGEEQPEAVDGDFPGGRYATHFIRNQSENKSLNVAQVPYFRYQTGSLGLDGGKSGSRVDELHLSVKNGPKIHSLSSSSSNKTSQDNAGLHDSSSDWEHVLKDDVSWKIYEKSYEG